MKKSILTLATLLTLSIASAQSYPKQPDPRVYEVTDNTVKKEETPDRTAQQPENTPTTQAETSQQNDEENASADNNKVAINRREEYKERN